LHQQGHEIGNHSFSHAYDLSRKHTDAIEADIVNGMDAISKITGAKPAGFRAPGYTINDRVYLLLAKHGVLYDSSVFPCPWYYAAKAAALGWYWLSPPGQPQHLGHTLDADRTCKPLSCG
jgi:peptidoglycan/xylan/chitin deacetylase (PgdA/CDA1 family)